MKAKGIVLMIFSLLGSLSAYSQVSKEELFDAVWSYEVDSLYMATYNANYLYSLRSAFKYSIWWDDVFFVDKTNNGEYPVFEYEMWSSLDRRGYLAEMEGVTDKTRKEKVRDLISRWDTAKLVDLFKRDETWRSIGYNPMLHIIRVIIRGGKIVSVNGIVIRDYHNHSKFACLNDHLIL